MIDLAIDSRIFIYSEEDEALQELDLMFNTENTELIGYPTFGTNFEQFCWNMTPSTRELRNYIIDKFTQSLYLNKVETYVYVNLLEGEFRQIYQVIIQIGDKSATKTRVYQIR